MEHRRLLVVLLSVVVLACAGRAFVVASESTSARTAFQISGDAVVASGEVVPAQEAQLSFTVVGRVETVMVAEGDAVAAGEVLATLETTLLEAQVAQAQAAVAAAQAQLPVVRAGPRPGQVAGAEAQLAAAEAAVVQAIAQRDQVAPERRKRRSPLLTPNWQPPRPRRGRPSSPTTRWGRI